MTIVRLDAHAHLYDFYALSAWCTAAVSGLQGGDRKVAPAVVVVDRDGQDSFARFRREAPGWAEVCDGRAGICKVGPSELIVIRGAQYNAQERVEVLGLGCIRADLEHKPAAEILSRINASGGLPCLPWSPGKWLGARGEIVRRLLEQGSPSELVVGDVAIRSVCGPRSSLLAHARTLGYRVLFGTDPLPLNGEETLVGSFGQELEVGVKSTSEELAQEVLNRLLDPMLTPASWGKRNGPLTALKRFVLSNVSRPVRGRLLADSEINSRG
jgi:hypothetical protein